MTPVDFKAWKARLGLSYREAAKALGINQRTAAAYASGQYPVPVSIAKLCAYLEKELGK